MTLQTPPPYKTDRQADFPADPLFIDRWSGRAFSGAPIPVRDLFTAFEAARWAPSSLNAQPWRFVFAHRDSYRFDEFLDLLNDKNRQWAANAGALIYVLSQTTIAYKDKVAPSPSHSFDAGAAWANFAHQAFLLGYRTRAIGGFDRARAPQVLGVPEDLAHAFKVECAIAVGVPDHADSLPEHFRTQEKPSSRRPLNAIIFENHFIPSPQE